jgi:hypothetical protein
MINEIRGKKSLMKKMNAYRIHGFQIIFEFKVRLVIFHAVMNYCDKLGIDLMYGMTSSTEEIINEKETLLIARVKNAGA